MGAPVSEQADIHPDFLTAYDEAIDSIPAETLAKLENVIIDFAFEPSAAQREKFCRGELMGLYVGTPLTKRTPMSYGFAQVPDRIWIFLGPIMRVANGDHEAAVARIREVVLHEIGHYFGLDDARLAELGY